MIFDIHWFKKHQKKILFLANFPIVKIWFRYVLRIRRCDLPLNIKITEIMPNSFSWGDRIIIENGKRKLRWTTDFRTHEKFGKRLYFGFRYLWMICHSWDIIVNYLGLRKLDLGFAEATFYPAAGANSPVDGHVVRSSVGESFANIVDGAGTSASATSTGTSFAKITRAGAGSFTEMRRGIYLFDTSSLDDSATINSAIFSIYGTGKGNAAGSPDLGVVSSNPTSNDDVVAGDYIKSKFGNTDFATRITYASYSTTGYNAFSLNASGLAAISLTGITKFGARLSWDIDESDGTTADGDSTFVGSFADFAGTSQDPKLVVDYTVIIEKILTDSISMTETFTKRIERTLSDSISMTEIFAKVRICVKEFIDTISMTDTIKKTTNKILSDTISMTDTIMKTINKIFTDTISMVESLIKTIIKIFTDTITMSEVLQRFKNGIKIIWDKISRSVSSWSKSSKNTTTWDNEDKS
jgi:hypothetical protein